MTENENEPIPINAVREASDRIRQMADHLFTLSIHQAAAKETYERAQAAYEEVERALFEAIEGTGLRAVRTPTGLFSLNDLAWPKIEDAEAARRWAEAEAPELITLNHQRLIKPVRDFLKGDAPELPPGIGFTQSRKIRITRSS